MSEKNLNFDQPVERRGTHSLKYDFAEERGRKKDILPLWVADMDFKTSSFVQEALIRQAEHGIYGYRVRSGILRCGQLLDGTPSRMEDRQGVDHKDSGNCLCTGNGGEGLYRTWGLYSDPGSGLLSIPGSD